MDYSDGAHSICNLNYSVPKVIVIENTEKYTIFSVPIQKLQEWIKMEKRLQKPYPTYRYCYWKVYGQLIIKSCKKSC